MTPLLAEPPPSCGSAILERSVELMLFSGLADHKCAMHKNSSNKLHAGIYTQDGEIGKLWDRLQHGERIKEDAELERLALAGIKRPEDRLGCIERHGQHPKHSGQTHLWTIKRKDGCLWMEELREK